MTRYFTIVIRSPFLSKDTPEEARRKVENVFSEQLGYRPPSQFISNGPSRWVWEKGSKAATYIGLVNWGTLYRRVEVELIEAGVLRLHYHFSWLTNVAVLATAARDEMGFLKKAFDAEELTMERLR